MLKPDFRIFCLLLLLLGLGSHAQNRNSGFSFLEIPQTAKLGVLNQPVTGPSGTDLWLRNPALADSNAQPWAIASYLPYYAGINQFNAGYIMPSAKKGAFYTAGLRYVNYGKFDGYDATGAPEGEFRASDWQLSGGYAWGWQHFRAGVRINWISSGVESYRASAVTFDIGGSFYHPKKDLSVGMLVSNLGMVLTDYQAADLPLPLNVQLGVAFKPEGMPFRFYFTGHHLQKARVQAATPNNPEVSGFGKVMQHINIGTEIVFSKNVQARFGYNYLRRQELKLAESSQGAGVSAGFGFRTKKFGLDLGRQWYHAAGGRTQLTLALNTENLF